MNFFAKNLIHLREKNKLKQAEIPDTVGFGRTTWIAYENGGSYPAFLDLLKIADYFKVTLSDLVEKDLSKEGNLIPTSGDGSLSLKSNLKGKGKGNLKAKNYPENEFLSVANEDQAILHRMPQVITVDSQGNENVIMVPVKARAGYLNGYSDPAEMYNRLIDLEGRFTLLEQSVKKSPKRIT